MLKVIAENYYTKEDYRFLENFLKHSYDEEIKWCERWHIDCHACRVKKSCKDIKQMIDYLHTHNK